MRDSGRSRGNTTTTLSRGGLFGAIVLVFLAIACLGSLPWTLSSAGLDAEGRNRPPRYNDGRLSANLLPPSWSPSRHDEAERLHAVAREAAREKCLAEIVAALPPAAARPALESVPEPTPDLVAKAGPFHLFGTDSLGRDLFVRCLAGGGVSIGIGLAAALLSVVIGTLYGAVAGAVGGRLDGFMMRIVDVLYGLPYMLLVVLLAVAGDAIVRRLETEGLGPFRSGPLGERTRTLVDLGVLLIAIGGVSWLTMARVIRGQVLSLKARPFMEAARALGVPAHRAFLFHLLPNLIGPITVYAALTIPQAMLEESFLSFLGIGVKPPLPSWGNLASEGLVELNPVRIRWWLIVFPCALLAMTLVALNLLGESLREAYDPQRVRRTAAAPSPPAGGPSA